MKMKRTFVWTISALSIVLGLLMDGYMPHRATAQSQAGLTIPPVERIGVMPFLKGRCVSDIAEALDCPVSRLHFNPENLSGDCVRILTRYVQEALRKRHEEKVIPLAKVMEIYERIPKGKANDTLRTLAKRLGEALEANLIIVGTVWRYRERSEGAVESSGSASVAFAIYLIDVTTGKMIWKGSFDKTQRTLTDDITKVRDALKKGVKWLSANELARYGVREIFKKFPI